MANIKAKDADGSDVFLKASGAGSDPDPHIREFLESNSAAILADTAAIDTNIATLAGAVAGAEFQVDVVNTPTVSVSGTVTVDSSGATQPVSAVSLPLPTGAATAANQSTANSSLSTIAGAVSGSEMQVDVISLPTVTETNSAAILADTAAIDTNVSTIAGAVSGSEMQVDVISLPTVTETNSAAILADTAAIDTNVSTIAGAVSGTEMQVDVVAALPAGTNNIGDVDVVSVTLPSTVYNGQTTVTTAGTQVSQRS
jgi:hypothetical protein